MNFYFQTNNFFKHALIALAVSLFLYQIYCVFNFPIWRDDAFFASVAKNLANGDGFSAVFFDQDYKFHYGISSGPALIMPAAAMIFIFGNHYWVPELTAVLLIWVLLFAIFIASKEVVGEKRKWAFCFLTLFMMLFFSCDEEGVKLYLWVRLMGEIPSALLVILAALIFSFIDLDKSRLANGGIMLGLALMIKTISAISALVILIMVSARIFFGKKPIIWIVIPAFCFVAPCFLFESIKIMVLGWKTYSELQQQNLNFYHTNAFCEKPFLYSLPGLVEHFGFAAIVILPSTIYVIYSSIKKNLNSPHFLAGIALLLASFLQVSWWIIYAIPEAFRHLSMGVCCYFAGIFLLICKLEYKAQFQIFFVSVFMISLLVSWPEEVMIIFSDNSNLREQKMVTEEIKILQKQDVEIISCGNNFELEYLLPESRNFKECTDFFKNYVPQKKGLLSLRDTETQHESPPALRGSPSPKSMGHKEKKIILVNFFVAPQKVLLIRYNQYMGEFITLPNQISERCKEEYLATENFSLLWCK